MKTSNKSATVYMGNSTILAEIECLKEKLQARYISGLVTEKQFIDCMRELSTQEQFQYNLQYESSDEDDLRQLVAKLASQQYSFQHGIAVARGKAMAKLRRQINTSRQLETI